MRTHYVTAPPPLPCTALPSPSPEAAAASAEQVTRSRLWQGRGRGWGDRSVRAGAEEYDKHLVEGDRTRAAETACQLRVRVVLPHWCALVIMTARGVWFNENSNETNKNTTM